MLENLGVEDFEVEVVKYVFGQFVDWFFNDLQLQVFIEDVVGCDCYECFFKLFVGDIVDFDEVYEWGFECVVEISVE